VGRQLPLLSAVLVGLLTALALPLVPQLRNETAVQWPAPGQQVESTMLTLAPYRPLELRVDVPCSPASPPVAGVLFATFPVEGPGAGNGMLVRRAADVLSVQTDGRTLWTGRAPPAGCLLRIDAVGDLTRIRLGDAVVVEVAVDPPQVAALATGMPTGTAGLGARLLADSRFETSPTALKKALAAVAALAGAACLLGLAALDRGGRRVRARRRHAWPWAQDTVLVLVLAFWALAGPMLADDGFNVAVADGFTDTGVVGNRYRWYNAPEAPFALVQQALVPLLEVGRSPWQVRLPAVLAAGATWLLLSRSLLPRLAGPAQVGTAQWLGLAAFLAWWMPYNLGARPEPFVALAATAVLVLVLQAVESGRRLPLALGGVVVASALAAAPSGLLAGAPYLVLGRRVLPLLRVPGVPRPLVAAAVLTPGAVTAGVAVFLDTGLAAVLEATRIHSVIGPTYQWWEEVARYELLLSDEDMGVFARRVPVLLGLGCLALLLATRRRTRATRPEAFLAVAAGCLALSFAVLVVIPSKWTHHFGGMAGYGALLLTGAVLHARRRLSRETSPVIAAAAAVAAVVLVAAAFSGPNLWVYYSSLGIPPSLPAALQSPVAWAAAGAAVVVVVELLSSRALPGPTGWDGLARAMPDAVPGAVVALALVTSIGVMLASFASASLRLDGSWSMAGENVGHLSGDHCGMADHVLVLRPTALPVAAELGSAVQSPPGAFRPGGAVLPAPGDLPPQVARWGSFATGPAPSPESATGTLVSAWYAVPDLPRDAELGIAVSGSTGEGNSVVVQYASRSAPERVLFSQPVRESEAGVDWRYVTFGAGGPGPAADLVRVVVTDATTGRDGWVASTQPILLAPSLLSEVLVPGSVSVDYPISFAFPCVRQVPVAHGIAALPTFGISAEPDLSSAETGTLQHAESQGGTLAMARQAAVLTVLPSRLVGLLPEDELLDRGWGTLVRYDYPYPDGRYDVTVRQVMGSSLDWGYRYPVPREPDPLDPFEPFDPFGEVDKG
jgi:hypothetical protein